MSRPTDSISSDNQIKTVGTTTSASAETGGSDITDIKSVGVTEGLPPVDKGRPYRWQIRGGIYDVED